MVNSANTSCQTPCRSFTSLIPIWCKNVAHAPQNSSQAMCSELKIHYMCVWIRYRHQELMYVNVAHAPQNSSQAMCSELKIHYMCVRIRYRHQVLIFRPPLCTCVEPAHWHCSEYVVCVSPVVHLGGVGVGTRPPLIKSGPPLEIASLQSASHSLQLTAAWVCKK